MKIIFDIRENELYNKCISIENTTNIVFSKEVLPLGDIILQTDVGEPILLIERKTFSDLLASIKDGRYEEQSYRLTNSSDFIPHSIIYLLEGMFSQIRNPQEKKIIFSSMTSLQFFKGFSVHRTSSTSETAEWLLSVANKIQKELNKGREPYYKTSHYLKHMINTIPNPENIPNDDNIPNVDTNTPILSNVEYCNVVKKVKKDNITPENIGEIILCQIPGISAITAIAIMKKFNNFPHFIQELQSNKECISNITTEHNGKMRKISKSIIENIYKFLLQPPNNTSCTSTLI